MRHRLQSRQVLAGVALTAVMFAALALSAGVLLLRSVPNGLTAYPARLFAHHAIPATVPVDNRLVLVSVGALLALLAYSLVATFFLNGLFRRTSSGEAFFLVSFVLSLTLEVVRASCAALTVAGLDPGLALGATRIVYMGRLFGLASLFCATLYSLGLRYGDYGALSGAGVLLALVMGAVVPVDTSRLTTGLVHGVSDGGGLLSVTASGAAIVALGALITPLVRQERRLVWYGVGVVFLLLGRELYSLGEPLFFALGLVLFAGGTWLASRSLERTYLGIV